MDKATVQFLGHAATLLTVQGKVIAIDPWLEGNPLCPDECKNPQELDLIVLTHGHADHASDATRLAKQTGAQIAATYELANILIGEGVPEGQLLHMNKGGTIRWNEIFVTLTHAYHSSSYDTKNGPVYAGEACGTVISDGSKSLYHAGDTALFSDMKLIGDRYRPDIALLPIGDCFTMGPLEAAHGAALIGCKQAIPIHHSTFPPLTGKTEDFEAACKEKGIEAIVLSPGEKHNF